MLFRRKRGARYPKIILSDDDKAIARRYIALFRQTAVARVVNRHVNMSVSMPIPGGLLISFFLSEKSLHRINATLIDQEFVLTLVEEDNDHTFKKNMGLTIAFTNATVEANQAHKSDVQSRFKYLQKSIREWLIVARGNAPMPLETYLVLQRDMSESLKAIQREARARQLGAHI